MIDVYASQRHYVDHLAPIVRRLGRRARLYVLTDALAAHARQRHRLGSTVGVPRGKGGPTLIAGYRDALDVGKHRRLALIEHGAGQTYLDVEHMGYAGGPGWERLDLAIVPGERAAKAWSAAYPELQIVVGSPRVDRLRTTGPEKITLRSDRRRVVAFTFHWPCKKNPETMTAWPDWRDQIAHTIARQQSRWRFLGHWHPRWDVERRREHPRSWWERLGIETVADAEPLFDQADLLVADNTSLLYEFAASHRPVLVLNGAGYRRDVEHGLRFWSHVPGHMLDPGDDLTTGIDTALRDDEELRAMRRRATKAVYTDLTGSTMRVVLALREWDDRCSRS